MNRFKLKSPFTPTGDQPQAIATLTQGLLKNKPEQVLLGVTGSGKTYTIANVIEKTQLPTLVISHNKTLAAQLYQEFRDFFPGSAVSYFVSYYDYYQPEAYIPQTDTYIEKETEINEEIDKLRLAATTNILTRTDTIVVASVSCIYNIGSPKEYGHFVLELAPGIKIRREDIASRLVDLQYERNNYGFRRGAFRVRGEVIDLLPAYEDNVIRMVIVDGKLARLERLDPLTGKLIEPIPATVIYPAKHYMTDPASYKSVFAQIEADLEKQMASLQAAGRLLEAQRLNQKVHYDLEMIQELGYVNGIENYSRYFDGRAPGSPPFTLFDYFKQSYAQKWLLIIDESHMSVPQIRGMYNGDRSRKQTLIDYGFRLPSALDNRPLKFDEFLRGLPQTIYVSATPDEWELGRIGGPEEVVEQLIRPTGLVDPQVEIRPAEGQIIDLEKEINARVARGERVLVTTLTKRMAEDLSKYLEEKGIKVQYLHADVETLKRTDVLADLRRGVYDVIVGINLLREGLDLPEVSLVAILDADKEGFLRSRVSLIQTMGRAARHARGKVILYADAITKSMQAATSEVGRRRETQLAYNFLHGIDPVSITKPIRDRLTQEASDHGQSQGEVSFELLELVSEKSLERQTPEDRRRTIKKLQKLMRQASHDLNFELAAQIRDTIRKLTEV